MPFSPDVKARIFVRSARICCLCYKQCGTNIEAAHIKAEADGGSNNDENAIPLCLDCHQEIGAYDPRHPKGNRFTSVELKARRDQLYALVESGTIQAQIVAHRFQQSYGGGGRLVALSAAELRSELPSPTEPSEEAKSVLKSALQSQALEALPLKLGLLSENDRAYVLDTLLKGSQEKGAMTALMSLLASDELEGNRLVSVEQVLRRVTLSGDAESKASFMTMVPLELLESVEPGLRKAFFLDVIGIMYQNQYEEVNAVTPAVIRVQSAIPADLSPSYLKALFSQANSRAWHGGPAAKRALKLLPDDLVRITFSLLDKDILWSYFGGLLREFVAQNKAFWPEDQRQMFEDFVQLERFEFGKKYFSGEA